ncbi:MAG: hypothetical protein A2X13_15435 [Bacteroidetes bacterium GWC2_33_15]|nr:MAG: hypothetical protein A2X13_15435 [Bacteroidetes bacterium GWC2_33_15]OFX70081.1 MAG: hypothetical protein A2X14_05725 [Bacteroidetes bacterium GWD2_33_33]
MAQPPPNILFYYFFTALGEPSGAATAELSFFTFFYIPRRTGFVRADVLYLYARTTSPRELGDSPVTTTLKSTLEVSSSSSQLAKNKAVTAINVKKVSFFIIFIFKFFVTCFLRFRVFISFRLNDI